MRRGSKELAEGREERERERREADTEAVGRSLHEKNLAHGLAWGRSQGKRGQQQATEGEQE